MSRIRVTIDQLVLRGFEAADRKALLEGLQNELSRALSDPRTRAGCAQSYSKPVLKLGRIPLEPGSSGDMKFGSALGHSIGKGLKP
jgi:hypothetical protein